MTKWLVRKPNPDHAILSSASTRRPAGRGDSLADTTFLRPDQRSDERDQRRLDSPTVRLADIRQRDRGANTAHTRQKQG